MTAAQVHILYRFFNEADELLYVGITNNPHNRLKGHQRDKQWFNEVARSTMQHFSSRSELAAAESLAIISEKPKYNIAGANPQPGTPATIRLKQARAQLQSGHASRFQAPDAIADDDQPPEIAREHSPCPKCRRFFVIREVDERGIPLNDRVRCLYCKSEWSDSEWSEATNPVEQRGEKHLNLIALLWDALTPETRLILLPSIERLGMRAALPDEHAEPAWLTTLEVAIEFGISPASVRTNWPRQYNIRPVNDRWLRQDVQIVRLKKKLKGELP